MENRISIHKLPRAIIVDLDGTLCNIKHRLHWRVVEHDHDEFNKRLVDDEPYFHILEMVLMYEKMLGYQILFVTCRNAKYRNPTIDWLRHNMIEPKLLFMRPENSREGDASLKKRIYNKMIRHRWDVKFVLEDRTRVVEMWRDLGLVCLQVAHGDY